MSNLIYYNNITDNNKYGRILSINQYIDKLSNMEGFIIKTTKIEIIACIESIYSFNDIDEDAYNHIGSIIKNIEINKINSDTIKINIEVEKDGDEYDFYIILSNEYFQKGSLYNSFDGFNDKLSYYVKIGDYEYDDEI